MPELDVPWWAWRGKARRVGERDWIDARLVHSRSCATASLRHLPSSISLSLTPSHTPSLAAMTKTYIMNGLVEKVVSQQL